MHGIHGRAPALATGLALARPDLSVWVVTGRRRRALDRRQPPDPRAAPQRAGEDPALQQPDLRADEGPVLAHLRAGQGDEVDPVRLPRPPLQPDRARPRRGGELRRAHGRHRPRAPGRRAARGGRARGLGLRRDLPELQRLQRRRLRGGPRQAPPREPDPRSSTASRSASGPRASAASSAATTSGCGSSTSTKPARTRCSSTTPTTPTRARHSRSRTSRSCPPGRPRSASSATSGGRSTPSR